MDRLGQAKGTQAGRLAERLGVPQLSTGDMLRAAIADGSPVGLAARDVMARGELVDDDIVVNCVRERIAKPDAASGFILDGFPRTLGQARAFDEALEVTGHRLDAVLELKVVEEVLLDRVVYRARMAKAEGQPVRADDNAEALKVRLEAYRKSTVPLANYYQEAGLLHTVDGLRSIDQVSSSLYEALGLGPKL